MARLAPVFVALRDAGTTDDGSAAEWTAIAERRARNMQDFAADLRLTGELRGDVSDREVADIIWSMKAPSTGRCSSSSAAGPTSASACT